MNSYGKTWHVWMTGMHGQKPDALPIGPSHLAWSFIHDGEDMPGLVEARDKRFGFDTRDARQDRQDLVALANACEVPGVRDNGDASTRPAPAIGMNPPAAGR